MEFEKICDTSKILFNMGVIHATLGEHEKAVSRNYIISALRSHGLASLRLRDRKQTKKTSDLAGYGTEVLLHNHRSSAMNELSLSTDI